MLAPVIATGNTAVLLASGPAVLAAVSLAEVLATSDVPGGVVNVLTGRRAELAPVLAAHQDVNAIDLTGAARRTGRSWSGSRPGTSSGSRGRARPVPEDWAAAPGLRRLLAFLETKTVWHPVGT